MVWDLWFERGMLSFRSLSFSLLVSSPLFIWGVYYRGYRLLSKSDSLVTSVVKQVETLILCTDTCLSEKFWIPSKGKVCRSGLNCKKEPPVQPKCETLLIFINSNHRLSVKK
jgi:hypothetical protein